MRIEVRGIVQHPGDGQLDESVRSLVQIRNVRIHKVAGVEKTCIGRQFEGSVAKRPGRCAVPDRPLAGQLGEYLDALPEG